MTAMSMIVQPHGAYFVTDTAYYLADGTVTKFGPKVTEVNFGPIVGPPAYAAFAMTGVMLPEHLMSMLGKCGVTDLRGVWEALPAIVRGFSEALPTAHRAPGMSDDSDVLLAFAFWDHASNRPYGYLIGNELCSPVRDGLMEPFQAVAMKSYVMRRLTKVDADFPYHEPAAFDPPRDAGALLDDQRDLPFEADGGAFTGVGGQGMLTHIGPAGVRYHILRTWPDEVGTPIPVTMRAAQAIQEHRKRD